MEVILFFLGDDQPDPLLSGILEMPPAPQYPLAFSSPQGFGDQSRDTHKKKPEPLIRIFCSIYVVSGKQK